MPSLVIAIFYILVFVLLLIGLKRGVSDIHKLESSVNGKFMRSIQPEDHHDR